MQVDVPKGAKSDFVKQAIEARDAPFSFADIERAYPGVSRETVRRVLRELKKAGKVESPGRGPGALWQKGESKATHARKRVLPAKKGERRGDV